MTIKLVVGATVKPMPTPKEAMVPMYSARLCWGTGASCVSRGDGPLHTREVAATPRPHATKGTSPSLSAIGPESTWLGIG